MYFDLDDMVEVPDKVMSLLNDQGICYPRENISSPVGAVR